MEERYLKEGYEREFQTINKILANFLNYLSLIGHNTALANAYKSKGKEFKKQEKIQREEALKDITYLENTLKQLESEIKRLMKESKKN